MSQILTYDLGYPFQFSIMGFGYTFLLAPIFISFFFLSGGLVAAVFLIPIGSYLVFIRKRLLISNEGYQIEQRILHFKWGKWINFSTCDAIIIKYTILNASRGNRGNAPKDPMKKIDLKQPNQHSSDTNETWLVHLIDNQHNKTLLINTHKTKALEVVQQIMHRSSLKPYLANFKKGFELNETSLNSGIIQLQNDRRSAH